MKNTSTLTPRRHGFTLIELLVVIAIIAVLAAMGFGAGSMAINKAKKTKAKKDCIDLVNAIQAYYDDYGHLPEVSGAGSAPGVKTESPLMNILVGLDKQANPKGVRYYQGPDAKGTSAERSYDGIYYEGNSAQLFDPWRKVSGNAKNNRHYFVMLDDDYDQEMQDPFRANRPLRGKIALAWTTGKDGEYTSGQESNPKNRDNVYSWK